MAAFDAIAGVSRTLRRLLLDRMASVAAVTTAPPDVTPAGVNGPRVNIYLYEVAESPALRNQDLPGRSHPASYGLPPLSLTLRYLLTSHAASENQPDSDLIAQTLLGDAMLVLHDFGARIDDLLLITNRAGAIGDPVLDETLQNEQERLKLVLQPAPAEETAKLWSAMPEANFRRSVVYDASVIRLEARRPRRSAQPVEQRRLLVSVARPPRIEAAYRTPPPPPLDSLRDMRIAIGEELTIEHGSIAGARLYVGLGTLEPIRVSLPSPGIIRIPLPDDQYPVDLDHAAVRPIPPEVQLRPGPLEIRLLAATAAEGVEGALDRGTPVAIERMLRSNVALMQLAPTVSGLSATSGTATDMLRVDGLRLWATDLPSEIVIGDAVVPVRMPQAGDPWAVPTPTSVEIPVAAVAAVLPARPQPYRVAAQVNGVRSIDTGFTFRLDP